MKSIFKNLSIFLVAFLALASLSSAANVDLDGGNYAGQNETHNGTGTISDGGIVTFNYQVESVLNANDDAELSDGTKNLRLGFDDSSADQSNAYIIWNVNPAQGLDNIEISNAASIAMSDYLDWTISWTGSSSTASFDNDEIGVGIYDSNTHTRIADGAFTSGTKIRFDDDAIPANSTGNGTIFSILLPAGVTQITVRADINNAIASTNVNIDAIDIDFTNTTIAAPDNTINVSKEITNYDATTYPWMATETFAIDVTCQDKTGYTGQTYSFNLKHGEAGSFTYPGDTAIDCKISETLAGTNQVDPTLGNLFKIKRGDDYGPNNGRMYSANSDNVDGKTFYAYNTYTTAGTEDITITKEAPSGDLGLGPFQINTTCTNGDNYDFELAAGESDSFAYSKGEAINCSISETFTNGADETPDQTGKFRAVYSDNDGTDNGQLIASDITTLTNPTLTVTNHIKEAPKITSNGADGITGSTGDSGSVSVAENTLAVTDNEHTEPDGDTVTYSISGGADASKFQINSNTGELNFIAYPDFEAPTDSDSNNVYIAEITVTDSEGSDSQTLNVSVYNVSDTGSSSKKSSNDDDEEEDEDIEIENNEDEKNEEEEEEDKSDVEIENEDNNDNNDGDEEDKEESPVSTSQCKNSHISNITPGANSNIADLETIMFELDDKTDLDEVKVYINDQRQDLEITEGDNKNIVKVNVDQNLNKAGELIFVEIKAPNKKDEGCENDYSYAFTVAGKPLVTYNAPAAIYHSSESKTPKEKEVRVSAEVETEIEIEKTISLNKVKNPSGTCYTEDDSHKITWEDMSSNEEGYIVERKIEDNDWFNLTILEAGSEEYEDTDISDNQDHSYRVIPFSEDEKGSYSAIITCKARDVDSNITGQEAFIFKNAKDQKCENPVYPTRVWLISTIVWLVLASIFSKVFESYIFNTTTTRLLTGSVAIIGLPILLWFFIETCQFHAWFPITVLVLGISMFIVKASKDDEQY